MQNVTSNYTLLVSDIVFSLLVSYTINFLHLLAANLKRGLISWPRVQVQAELVQRKKLLSELGPITSIASISLLLELLEVELELFVLVKTLSFSCLAANSSLVK